MKILDEIKEILARHREELSQKYGVKRMGIFGSYARGEQTDKSDLDLIIEFEQEETIGGLRLISLMIDLEEYLEEIIGIKVHLASKRHAMESDKWKHVEKDLIYV